MKHVLEILHYLFDSDFVLYAAKAFISMLIFVMCAAILFIIQMLFREQVFTSIMSLILYSLSIALCIKICKLN